MKKILLIEDHKIVRDGLKFYFEDNENFEISAEAENGQKGLQMLEQEEYDLVITDISMPIMDGVEFMKNVQEKYPDQKVIALTMMGESQHIKQMISYGVNGYLLKNTGESEIMKAIEKVLNGENHFSNEVTSIIMNDLASKRKPKQRLTITTSLSDREKEILRLIVDEYSNKEIADKLFISVRTVDAHKRNMLEKTGAKNVAGLVMYAIENNIIQ